MNSKTLDDEDHVSRYCSPRTIDKGVLTGMSFLPRSTDDYLSVNWLEYFKEPSFASAIVKIRDVFYSKQFNIKPDGKFAIINVQEIKFAGLSANRNLQIERKPFRGDKSHTGIIGYTEIDLEIAEDLACRVKPHELYPAVDIVEKEFP